MADEQKNYKPIPEIRQMDDTIVQKNYIQIKQDVEDLVEAEIGRLMMDVNLQHLIVKK